MSVLVKTLNGLAFASVKNVKGLAVGSLKNITGLDTTAGSSFITFSVGALKGSTTGNSVTTDAVTTSGNFIVGAVAYYDGGVAPTISDSFTNSYTYLTLRLSNTIVAIRIFYCANATTGASHTVTATTTGTFPSIGFGAFANVKTSGPFDAENGFGVGSSSTSIQPGSVTPAGDNELFFLAVNGNLLNEVLTTAGYTKIGQINSDGANHVCIALWYKIQTTGGAENPTTSWTTNTFASAALAAFLNT